LHAGNNRVARGRCYGNLGAVLHDEGKLTEAAAHYWKAIQTLEETGEVRMLANFFGNLAVLEQELGSLGPARRHYEKASALLHEIGDPRLRGIVIGNHGTLEAELGDWQAARRQHERALELLLPLQDPHSLALCRARLGAALSTLGLTEEAEEQLSLAQDVSSESDWVGHEAVRLQRAFLELAWARSALVAEDPDEAEQRLAQAVARCEHVRAARAGERSLLALSDDVRAALRALDPLIAALKRDLAAVIESSASTPIK
jgi:tetratricopeptide (TPR) repeat protein